MERRNFIRTATLSGASALLASSASAKNKPRTPSATYKDIKPEQIYGPWFNPYLRQPASIIVSGTPDTSEIDVSYSYFHARFGIVVFEANGTFVSGILKLEYEHQHKELPGGTINMCLTKEQKTLTFRGNGSCAKGTWESDDLLWYKLKSKGIYFYCK